MSRPIIRAAVGVIAGAALVAAGVALDSTAPASAAPTVDSFTTPGTYDWTVPAGVTSVEIDVEGAQGGTGHFGASGGLGGRIVGTFATTPGDTVKVHVGAAGVVRGAAGANGGGSANSGNVCMNGGSGGDASDVRLIGDTLADRIIVAGGGGGAGGIGSGATGGAGGGDTATDGAGILAAAAGTSSAGGAGGVGGGSDGALGQGGAATGGCDTGGGGGGGYYGGGAGGHDDETVSSAGGGGSAYLSPGATPVSSTSGVGTGDGSVTFTYTVVEPTTTTTSTTTTAAPTTTTTTSTTIAPTTTVAPTTTTPTTVPPATPTPQAQCPSPVPPVRVFNNAFGLGVAKFLIDDCGATARAVSMGGQLFWVLDPAAGSSCPRWGAQRVVATRDSILNAKHLLDDCQFSVRGQREGRKGAIYVAPLGYPTNARLVAG